jgi:hypothetical protein
VRGNGSKSLIRNINDISGILNKVGTYNATEKATEPKITYYKKYEGVSSQIDVVFKAIGVPAKYYGKWDKRIPVANANGIKSYVGTAAQNKKLISLAKNGKLKKV